MGDPPGAAGGSDDAAESAIQAVLTGLDEAFGELDDAPRAGLLPGLAATRLRLGQAIIGLEGMPPPAAVATLRHRAALGTAPSQTLARSARAVLAPHAHAGELYSVCLWAGLAAEATPPDDESDHARALAEAFTWGVAPALADATALSATLSAAARSAVLAAWVRRRLMDTTPDLALLTDVALELPQPVARLGVLVDLACRHDVPPQVAQGWAPAARAAHGAIGNFWAPGVADTQLAAIVRWVDPAEAERLLASAAGELDENHGIGDRAALYDALFNAAAWVAFPRWRSLAEGLSHDRRLKQRPELYGQVALAAVTSLEHLASAAQRDAGLSALSDVPRGLREAAFELAFLAESARSAATIESRSIAGTLARLDARLPELFVSEHGQALLPTISASYADAAPQRAVGAAAGLPDPIWRALWLLAVADRLGINQLAARPTVT